MTLKYTRPDSSNPGKMSTAQWEKWRIGISTLMSMVQAQHLRMGNETSPRVFVDNLQRHTRGLAALVPKREE